MISKDRLEMRSSRKESLSDRDYFKSRKKRESLRMRREEFYMRSLMILRISALKNC